MDNLKPKTFVEWDNLPVQKNNEPAKSWPSPVEFFRSKESEDKKDDKK